MKPVKTFQIPREILEQIGKEWEGTYTVHMLNAREYLQTAEELVQEARQKPNWNGELSEMELKYRLTCKATTKDGQPLNPNSELPAKLYELLSSVALPVNTLTRAEAQQLFLELSKNNQPESAS